MPGPHQYYSDETRGHKTWQNNIVHQQDMIGKCQMLRDMGEHTEMLHGCGEH